MPSEEPLRCCATIANRGFPPRSEIHVREILAAKVPQQNLRRSLQRFYDPETPHALHLALYHIRKHTQWDSHPEGAVETVVGEEIEVDSVGARVVDQEELVVVEVRLASLVQIKGSLLKHFYKAASAIEVAEVEAEAHLEVVEHQEEEGGEDGEV